MKTKTWMITGMSSVGELIQSYAAPPFVTLENTEGQKIDAWILASDDTTVTFKRVGAEKTFSLDQEGGTEESYHLPEFSFLYDAGDSYNYGYKYQGYAVILHDCTTSNPGRCAVMERRG